MHLQVPNEPSLRNEMKRRFQSQKWDNTTLSTGRKRWLREKLRKLFIWWYWYIYIYIYYDGSQYKDIFFYVKYLMIKYWWVTSYEFVVRIIYLKGLFPHPNVSEFHLLSYLIPPFTPPYRYIRGVIRVKILGGQQLKNYIVKLRISLLFLWYWILY